LVWRSALATVALGLAALAGSSAADPAPSPAEAQRRFAGRLDGRHFTARVLLVHEVAGKREQRSLTVWRDDAGGHERLMARFEEPPDMRGLGLLYLENAGRPSDYFLYQPATGRVRRVAEALAREDVYGIDLEYLGFGLAEREPFEAVSLEAERLGERETLRLVQQPAGGSARLDRRVLWLDPESFVPLRVVHERAGARILDGATEEIRSIQGVQTPWRMVFDQPGRAERVTLQLDAIDYEAPVADSYFSTLALIKRR